MNELFEQKRVDGFSHESPIRAFTTFDVTGAYAIGKGFRPSMQHLPTYLDAMERKEGWCLVQLLEPGGTPADPTLIFHKARGEERLKLVIEQAAKWFDDYERQHRAKGTAESQVKADTNRERATILRAAIT